MWRWMVVAVLLIAGPVWAQLYRSGATNPAPQAVSGSGVKLVDGYRTSCTVEVDESATGCVWVIQHQGPAATDAFASGNGGKRLCRGVSGQPDPPGYNFNIFEDGWNGPLFAKPASGFSSVLVTRSCS